MENRIMGEESMELYLDNSATTKVCQAAADKVMALMTTIYGNPSSLHTMGFEAEQEMSDARFAVAQALGVQEGEITFTSGGTEANNLAILGAAYARKRHGRKIVTTAIEHASVLSCMQKLEQEGFVVEYLQPQADGTILPEQLEAAIDDETILVSVMMVNNEVGSILPVQAAAEIIKRKHAPALLHCDAVQAFGKLPFRPRQLGIDLLTVSGHKIHAPKGIGALYVQQGVRLLPQMLGGGQEKGLRAGTEAVPLIGGFGAAVHALPELKPTLDRIQALHDACRAQLEDLPGVVINSPRQGSPYVLNFSTCCVRAETLLHFLAARQIYVSGGSACAKGKQSHVLTAMGLEKQRIQTAIRVSFSRETQEAEIAALVQAVQAGMETLAGEKR